MKQIIKTEQIYNFLEDVENHVPNLVAAVISDSDGWPIGSKIPKNFPYNENILALEAIARNRSFLGKSKYFKIKIALNKEKSVRMLLLVNKPKNYLKGFKKLKKVVRCQMLF